mgnify:CR=1 FL=1
MLKGKVALVTGSSRGIGKAIAIALAKEGADIIVNYANNNKKAEELADRIKKLGNKAIAIKADVSNYSEVSKMIKNIGIGFKKIDILVNNAGIVKDRTLKNMTQEEWHSVIDTNLSSIFNVTKQALPLMGENGRIINISSIIWQYGNFGQCNYGAAKAGIIGFTKSLAKELGKKKITVNAVAPGFIKTDIIKGMPFFKRRILKHMIPLKEEGNPEDVANVVVFLASEKSRYITGSVINVDGGLAF